MSNYGMSFSPLGGSGSSDEELMELLSRLASSGRVDIGRLPAPTVRGGMPLFESLLSQQSSRPSLSDVLAPSEPVMAQAPTPANIPALEESGPEMPAEMPVDPSAPPSDPMEEPIEPGNPGEYSPDPSQDPGQAPVQRPGDIYEAGVFPEDEDELFASLMGGGFNPAGEGLD